jgi:nucleoside-diphosphate-sugar epimerase
MGGNVSMLKRLITWGSGELGGRVAKRWRAQGGEVIGLTQTEQRHADLRARGVEPKVGSPVGLLQEDDVLLLALPGHALQREAIETLSNTPSPNRVVLISSTGYYGLPTGLVNEETPPGNSERSIAIAATEQTFFDWAGDKGVIIRLGGLYRPGRGPFSALARRGQPPPGPPNKTLALIHYDDAATATLAALVHPTPCPIYVGVTPPCPTRAAFYRAACERLGLAPPIFTNPLAESPAHFEVTLLRRDLLPHPAYPDWRAALSQLKGTQEN